MDRVFFFDFDSRAWSCRMCAGLLPPWTFGHATKRGRSVFAFGSAQGEAGTLEVGSTPLPGQSCSAQIKVDCSLRLEITLSSQDHRNSLPFSLSSSLDPGLLQGH
jgi:hypothetical protein